MLRAVVPTWRGFEGIFLQRLAIGRDRPLQPRRPALPLPERQERIAEIVLRPRPLKRNALAGPLLQRGAIGRDRLLQTRRPALPLPKRESATPRLFCTIAQSSGTRSRSFLQRGAIGRHRLLQMRRPALPLPELPERDAEIVLRHRPVERNPLASVFLQRGAIGRDRLLQTRRPALPRPETR